MIKGWNEDGKRWFYHLISLSAVPVSSIIQETRRCFMKYLKKIGKVAAPVTALLLPLMSLALDPFPTATGSGSAWTITRIEDLIERIGNFMIFIGIIIAVVFIIWGGIKYMTAGGNETKATEARTAIFNGIIGAAVVLGVGVILRTAAALITGTFFGV